MLYLPFLPVEVGNGRFGKWPVQTFQGSGGEFIARCDPGRPNLGTYERPSVGRYGTQQRAYPTTPSQKSKNRRLSPTDASTTSHAVIIVVGGHRNIGHSAPAEC
jgi:hypothetical protein